MSVTRWTPATFRNEGFGRRFSWIDLVNSQYHDGLGGSTDYLADDGWLASFLRVSGFPPIEGRSKRRDALSALRKHLRAAIEQIAENRAVSPSTLSLLNRALSKGVIRCIDVSSGRYELRVRPKRLDWSWVESQIVASFGAFLESGQLRRLKICPNGECRWAFYDETKNNIRRWCNDRRCGNRDKVRRHRARRRL